MKKIVLILIALIPMLSFSQQVAKGLTASNGVFVGFYEYKPTDYSSYNGKYPLIIFLHGIGERGNGTSELPLIKKVAIPKYIDQGKPMKWFVNGKWESFVVLSPQLSTSYGSWQMWHIDEMINYAIKNLKVDPNRIILTGLSLGGGAIWKYTSTSLTNASKIAAIAPICGTCSMSNASNIAGANVAVWGFHNRTDQQISYTCTSGAIDKINALNPAIKPILTLYPSGTHNAWDKAYDFTYNLQNPTIWEWFLGQSRSLAPNKLPSANAGSDIAITTTTGSITLRGSGSDPDGNVERYAWKKISGPAYGTITTSSAASTTVTGLTVAGVYEYELTVMDNRASWARDIVKVTVTAGANTAPVARAGADVTIQLPTNSATLNGSSSTDADGTITKYAWTKVSSLAGTISSASASSTSITGLVQGTHTFRLTVTDNAGATHSDDVVIIVKAANVAPVARAGSDVTITLPANSTTLSGASSTDADGTITSYAWTKVSTLAATIASPSSSSTSITGLVQGTHTFRLTVTDNNGAKHSDDLVVVVNAAQSNQPPVARAGSDISIQLPTSSVTLNGSTSSDADGSITKYSWTKVSTLAATIASASSSSTSVTGLAQGTHTFRLTVTDNNGATHSDDVIVIVLAAATGNKPPVANAGADKMITAPSSSVIVDGGASSDPDGTIATYLWTKVSGPTALIFYPNNPGTSLRNLTPGVYIFRLTVTDNLGLSASDDVQVTVNSNTADSQFPNVAPVARAGSDVVLTSPSNSTTLSGTGSSDSDGSIVSYSWTKVSTLAASVSSPSSATTSVTGLAIGVHTFRLTVTDNSGSTHSDEVIVEVRSSSNQAPTARAGSDRILTLPASSVVVDGGTSSDADGTIVTYQWTKVSGPSALIYYPNNQGTSIRNMTAGVYVFRLTVTDDKGARSSDDVQVTVNSNTSSSNTTTSTELAFDRAAEPAVVHEKLGLYPNPATSNLTLSIASNHMGQTIVNIFDASGKQVKRVSLQKGMATYQQSIDVSGLRNGVYHLEVVIDQKSKLVSRFIKQ